MPETSDRHDLVVVGAGSAGLVAADFAARFGADVLVVEKERVGGDCTWTGCVPSKALLHEAFIAHRLRTEGVVIDFRNVATRVREAVERVYSFETPEKLAARGIQVLLGPARFLNRDTLDVDGRRVHGRNFIVCTGAIPQLPPLRGLEAVPHLTYEQVFDLERLPQRLIVVGGGPVGVELAQAFLHLGSQVTLLEKEQRLLAAADPEAAEILERRLVAEGMRIDTGADVQEVSVEAGEISLRTQAASFVGDVLLVATGRAPELDGLDLGRAGVEYDRRGIKVDDHLRTTRAHIYAAGDVTGSFQFTHYAGWQGYVAARNALFPGSDRGVAKTVPWAVFTDPEIAQVGLTEQEARAGGVDFRVLRLPLERVDRAQTLGDTDGLLKLIVNGSGDILGATVVASAAAEVANELSVALAADLSLEQLARTIHLYPTFGLGIQQLASEFAMQQAGRGLRGAVVRLLAGGRRNRYPGTGPAKY